MLISGKKWGFTSKHHILTRYLLSYTLIFLIPLSTMSLFVFNYFFKHLENEVSKNSYSNLYYISTMFDTKINELNKISYQILTNKDLTSYNIDMNDPFTGMKVINLLKYSINANHFIYEAVYYTGESNLLYSSASSYSTDTFWGSIYKYKNCSPERFLDLLNNSTRNIYMPAQEIVHNQSNERFLTFIYPSINKNDGKRTVFFLAKEAEILKSLEKFPGNTIILDNDSNIILAQEDKDYLHTKEFLSLLKKPKSSGFTTIVLGKEKFFLSTLKSPETEWLYAQLIPQKEVSRSVNYIRTIFLYGIALITLTGGVIITFLSWTNYNPIKQLRKFAEEKLGNPLNSENELEAIRVSINNMMEDSSRLQEKIRSSQPAVKEFVLSNFLKGNFKDINEFNEKAKEAGLAFTYTCYQVVIFEFSNTNFVRENYNNIVNYLETSLPSGLEGYCKNDTGSSRIILILSTDKADNANVRSALELIHAQIFSRWKANCTTGAGNLYKDIEQIWKSYIEASTAVDYKLIKGTNRIIYFSDIEFHNMDINIYPKQKIESIALCIKNGNTGRLKDIVDDILMIIKENNTPLFMAKCICFDIINSFMKVMYDINKAYVTRQSRNFDLQSLIEFDTVEDLAKTIKTFCIEICEYIQASVQKDSDIIDKVCSYINDNYFKQDFSIQNTADHFGMSLANLSQYYKSRTGKTLSEYVNFLQMEKIKDLLLTTNEPLQNIIERVGLYNTSNFIRKFKNEVGMTPGEFRKSRGQSNILL